MGSHQIDARGSGIRTRQHLCLARGDHSSLVRADNFSPAGISLCLSPNSFPSLADAPSLCLLIQSPTTCRASELGFKAGRVPFGFLGNLGVSLSSTEVSGRLRLQSKDTVVTQSLPESVASWFLSHNLKKEMYRPQ